MKRTRKYTHKKHHKKTFRHKYKNTIKIPSITPIKISNKINNALRKGSYSPTINKQLITLKSIDREDLMDCNIEAAYQLKEPLQIGVKEKCYYYYLPEAKRFLLRNLAANKHIDPNKVVPPIQSHSNCWFNAMFVTFFVSDKGRKFFHFLCQLMIEGK
jgi:hypothetical protein